MTMFSRCTQVGREQDLVEALQEELASSQGLSDGLQLEVRPLLVIA